MYMPIYAAPDDWNFTRKAFVVVLRGLSFSVERDPESWPGKAYSVFVNGIGEVFNTSAEVFIYMRVMSRRVDGSLPEK